MAPRAAVAGLALVAALAGCLGAEAPPDPEPLSPGSPAPGGPGPGPVVTLPGAAVAPGTRWVLDYWGDRAEVVLLDATVTLQNLVDTSSSGCILCNAVFLGPENGTFVAPGAERVEFTATFTPPPTAPTLHVLLAHRTAGPAPPAQQEVRSGEPLLLPVGPEDADAPFAPASQWWFALEAQADPAAVIPAFDVQVTAVAKRAAALPDVGEPADPWSGNDRIALLEGFQAEESAVFLPEMGSLCMACTTGWDSQGGGLVPPGARLLEARVAWTWPGPTKPSLGAWNLLDLQGTRMVLGEDGASERTFTLEVPPDQLDSPYQRRSMWGFYLEFDTQGTDGGVLQGVATVDVAVARAPR